MHRRSLLGIGLGLGAWLADPPLIDAGPRTAAATLRGPSLDLLTPEGNVLAMAKIAADLDLRKTKYGWYDGALIGIAPGGATRDLLGIRGMSCQRLVHADPKGPGGPASWLVLQKEVGFFTSLATGEVLDDWRNPYTDEEVQPFHIANPAVNRPIEPMVRDTRFYDTAGGSAQTRPFLLPWRTVADRAFVEQRTHIWAHNPLDPAVWKRESSGNEIQITDLQSYELSIRDLQNPALTSVTYAGHWVHWRPWQPWMLMGDRAGGCLYSATTGSAASLDELPQDLVAVVRTRAPEFLVAPTVVQRSEPSLTRYMHERSPAPPGPSRHE